MKAKPTRTSEDKQLENKWLRVKENWQRQAEQKQKRPPEPQRKQDRKAADAISTQLKIPKMVTGFSKFEVLWFKPSPITNALHKLTKTHGIKSSFIGTGGFKDLATANIVALCGKFEHKLGDPPLRIRKAQGYCLKNNVLHYYLRAPDFSAFLPYGDTSISNITKVVASMLLESAVLHLGHRMNYKQVRAINKEGAKIAFVFNQGEELTDDVVTAFKTLFKQMIKTANAHKL